MARDSIKNWRGLFVKHFGSHGHPLHKRTKILSPRVGPLIVLYILLGFFFLCVCYFCARFESWIRRVLRHDAKTFGPTPSQWWISDLTGWHPVDFAELNGVDLWMVGENWLLRWFCRSWCRCHFSRTMVLERSLAQVLPDCCLIQVFNIDTGCGCMDCTCIC